MFSKKLGLYLAVISFGLVCVNAERNVLSSDLNLADNESLHECDVEALIIRSQYYDFSYVANCLNDTCVCKIHHNVTDTCNLGLIEALCEVCSCDDVLGKGDREMDCGCKITCEKCGCRTFFLCEQHLVRLDEVVKSKLNLIKKAFDVKMAYDADNCDMDNANQAENLKKTETKLDTEPSSLNLVQETNKATQDAKEVDEIVTVQACGCKVKIQKDCDYPYIYLCKEHSASFMNNVDYPCHSDSVYIYYVDLSDVDLSDIEPNELQVRS